MNQATLKFLELVDTGNFDDEVHNLMEKYHKPKDSDMKIDMLERICVRLMYALHKERNKK